MRKKVASSVEMLLAPFSVSTYVVAICLERTQVYCSTQQWVWADATFLGGNMIIPACLVFQFDSQKGKLEYTDVARWISDPAFALTRIPTRRPTPTW